MWCDLKIIFKIYLRLIMKNNIYKEIGSIGFGKKKKFIYLLIKSCRPPLIFIKFLR